MVSQYSPPVLYLTDDDDDNNNNSYQNSYAQSTMIYQNRTGKKRTLTDGNIRVNPSVVNWSKRARNEQYQNQLIRQDMMTRQPEMLNYDTRSYNHLNNESHSFYAFDWTNEGHTPIRNYSNVTSPVTQMNISQPINVMNVVKQHLQHLDSPSSYPQSHKTHRYHQHSVQKNLNTSMTASVRSSSPSTTTTTTTISQSSLPLPLPTPTSSYNRTHSQRIHPEKNLRIPYSHSNVLPQIHHPVKTVYQTLRPPLPPSITHRATSPESTSEIRQQPLNGSGILTAFYDSKYYRCNICKFKCSNSPALLQHLFTHIFYCNQCPFYSYSHHNLNQHIFEKHSNHITDISDPKTLELLYITRCQDGTFTLCTDSSPTQSQPPPKTPVIPSVSTPTAQISIVPSKTNARNKSDANNIPTKRKIMRRRPRQKKIVIEIPDETPQPLLSSSSSSIVIDNSPPIAKEKPTHIYVLMKHRRCYSISNPPCVHPLTLEYNICREHTIRHMCHTHSLIKRRKFKPQINCKQSIVDVTICLKSIVNQIINKEDNQNSTNLICLLPNHILNRIYATEDLESVTSMLKLTNKYTKSIEQKRQYQSESLIRESTQHVFMLSSSAINKIEPTLSSTLQTSITIGDSPNMQTKLQTLPISCDNTHRFLKGHLNSTLRSIAMQSSTNDIHRQSIESKLSDSTERSMSRSVIDKDNCSNSSPKSKSNSSPCVIVLD